MPRSPLSAGLCGMRSPVVRLRENADLISRHRVAKSASSSGSVVARTERSELREFRRAGGVPDCAIGRRFAPTRWLHPGYAPLRQNANLLKRINVIWVVQSHCEKYSASRLTQITSKTHPVSSHSRGVSRSSRTRDGMRWTRTVPLTNGTEADGEVVWA